MKGILCLPVVFFISLSMFAQNESIVLGNEYYHKAQFELAEIQYRKALVTNTKDNIALYNLANALQKQKKYDEALKIMEQLIAGTTDKNVKSSTFYNQGVAHTKQKNLEPSIESYKNALRLNPDDKEARENLQKALLERKSNAQSPDQQKKQDPKMSPKEADQKLKLLQQKEKDLQQKKQDKNKQQGQGQQQKW